MQRRRWAGAVVRAAFAAAALLGAADAAAQVVPVRLYPLDASSLKKAEAADAQSLFEAAFARIERRARSFVQADPLVLRRSCGARASTACLAQLAGPGVVVTGAVSHFASTLSFTLLAVDGRGRIYGPLRVGIDAYISSAEPIARALLELESRIDLAPPAAIAGAAPAGAPARGSAQPPRAPSRPIARSDASPPRPELPAPALSPRPELDVATAVPLPPPPRGLAMRPPPTAGGWLGPTGKWLAATGVGLLAAGAAAGLVGKRSSDALDARYRDRALATTDVSAYQRVDRMALATNVLLVAGGIATAGGLGLWALAPTAAPAPGGGAQLGVSGRF